MFGFKKAGPKVETKAEPKVEVKVESKVEVIPQAEIDIEHLPIRAIEWKADEWGNERTCLSFMIQRDGKLDKWGEEYFTTTIEQHNTFVSRFRKKMGLKDDGSEVKN